MKLDIFWLIILGEVYREVELNHGPKSKITQSMPENEIWTKTVDTLYSISFYEDIKNASLVTQMCNSSV